jgi:hypothetical protein
MPRHRKRNHYNENPMTPGQKILLVGGGLAVGGLLYTRAKAASKKSGPAITGCNPSPYTWNEAVVKDAIETVVEDGETNPLTVATVVADAHFGDYPGGGNVSFPPDPAKQNPAGVDCVWSRVTALVDVVFEEKGIKPGGPGVKPFEIVLPWLEDPETGGTPKDGKLFRDRPGWIFLGETPKNHILASVLTNAGVPNTAANRVEYEKAIFCSPWNDALYGFKEPAGVQGYYAPHNRGIILYPVHADNATRMMQGLPARRSITNWTYNPNTKKHSASHDGTGGALPTLWLPGIEHNVPTVIIASYNDGLSAINPPKEIMAFRVENVSPGNYGCAPWNNNAQPLVF